MEESSSLVIEESAGGGGVVNIGEMAKLKNESSRFIADVEVPGLMDITDLMSAVIENDINKVQKLIKDKRIDLDEKRGKYKYTALMVAAMRYEKTILIELLRYGAAVDERDSTGNTALMLAANKGHVPIVEVLATKGGNVMLQNHFGESALMLAIVSNHFRMAAWLLDFNPDIYRNMPNLRNSAEETAVMIAARLGRDDVVQHMVDMGYGDLHVITSERVTVLMCAVRGLEAGSQDIVDFLLEHNVDVDETTADTGDSALLLSIDGRPGVVEKLLQRTAFIDYENFAGETAFMRALERGNPEMIKSLIKYGAKPVLLTPSDVGDVHSLAWLTSSPHFVCEWLAVDTEPASMLPDEVFSQGDVRRLVQHLVMEVHATTTPEFLPPELLVIASSAAAHKFHFSIYLAMVLVAKHPNVLLDLSLPTFFEELKHLEGDIIIYRLVCLIQCISQRSRAGFKGMVAKVALIEKMLVECFNTDSPADTLVRLLEDHSKDCRRYLNDVVSDASAVFSGTLDICMSANLPTLFSLPTVSEVIDNLWLSSLRDSGKGDFYHLNDEFQQIYNLKSDCVYVRYSPLLMFTLEFLSKVLFLAMLIYTSFRMRQQFVDLSESDAAYAGSAGASPTFSPTGYDGGWRYTLATSDYYGLEIFLIILTGTLMLHAYGRIVGNTYDIMFSLKNLTAHLCNIWNVLDAMAILFVQLWFWAGHFDHREMSVARGALASACIFQSIALLRYFTLYEPVGTLVYTIMNTMRELCSFAIILVVCATGFAVSLYVLLPDTTGYSSFSNTLTTLYGLSVAMYDDSFDSISNDLYYGIVVTIQILYVIGVAIILTYMMVAQMVSRYDDVYAQSQCMCKFEKAKMLREYLMLEEKSPFCMLPAPFNFISIVLMPCHKYGLRDRVKHVTEPSSQSSPSLSSSGSTYSLAGSVNDKVAGVLASLIIPFLELGRYFYNLGKRLASDDDTFKWRSNHVTVVLTFPIYYIIYAWELIITSMQIETRVDVSVSKGCLRFPIAYTVKSGQDDDKSASQNGTQQTVSFVILGARNVNALRTAGPTKLTPNPESRDGADDMHTWAISKQSLQSLPTYIVDANVHCVLTITYEGQSQYIQGVGKADGTIFFPKETLEFSIGSQKKSPSISAQLVSHGPGSMRPNTYHKRTGLAMKSKGNMLATLKAFYIGERTGRDPTIPESDRMEGWVSLDDNGGELKIGYTFGYPSHHNNPSGVRANGDVPKAGAIFTQADKTRIFRHVQTDESDPLEIENKHLKSINTRLSRNYASAHTNFKNVTKQFQSDASRFEKERERKESGIAMTNSKLEEVVGEKQRSQMSLAEVNTRHAEALVRIEELESEVRRQKSEHTETSFRNHNAQLALQRSEERIEELRSDLIAADEKINKLFRAQMESTNAFQAKLKSIDALKGQRAFTPERESGHSRRSPPQQRPRPYTGQYFTYAQKSSRYDTYMYCM
jgi:ankyrin repeat protein